MPMIILPECLRQQRWERKGGQKNLPASHVPGSFSQGTSLYY